MQSNSRNAPPHINLRMAETFVKELPACLASGVGPGEVKVFLDPSVPVRLVVHEIAEEPVCGPKMQEIRNWEKGEYTVDKELYREVPERASCSHDI